MKMYLKSAFIAGIAALFMALPLTACSSDPDDGYDLGMHRIFERNEVPPDIMSQPRVVQVPPPRDYENMPWPRLGDVPAKPKDFSPQPVINQTITEMQYDRTQGELARQSATSGTAGSAVLMPPQLPPQ